MTTSNLRPEPDARHDVNNDPWAADDQAAQAPIKPLTREQARALIAQQPKTPYHWVILAQLGVAVVAALLAWCLRSEPGKQIAAMSALGAGFIAAGPSALMLYGVTRSPLRQSIVGPLVWLMVKFAATLVMFLLVIRALGKPDWPVLLITLMVALKMYWIVVLARRNSVKSGIKS